MICPVRNRSRYSRLTQNLLRGKINTKMDWHRFIKLPKDAQIDHFSQNQSYICDSVNFALTQSFPEGNLEAKRLQLEFEPIIEWVVIKCNRMGIPIPVEQLITPNTSPKSAMMPMCSKLPMKRKDTQSKEITPSKKKRPALDLSPSTSREISSTKHTAPKFSWPSLPRIDDEFSDGSLIGYESNSDEKIKSVMAPTAVEIPSSDDSSNNSSIDNLSECAEQLESNLMAETAVEIPIVKGSNACMSVLPCTDPKFYRPVGTIELPVEKVSSDESWADDLSDTSKEQDELNLMIAKVVEETKGAYLAKPTPFVDKLIIVLTHVQRSGCKGDFPFKLYKKIINRLKSSKKQKEYLFHLSAWKPSSST